MGRHARTKKISRQFEPTITVGSKGHGLDRFVERPTRVPCKMPDCGRDFKTIQGLANHVTKTHGMTMKEYKQMYMV